MNYSNLLLNRLLDKYERSRAYLDENSKRRIMLRFCLPEFPEYDIEKSERRELLNSVVQDLCEKGFVEFEWLKHEQGNIIEKVWLRLDRISHTYREAGRIPKREKAAAVLAAVRESRQSVTLPWLHQFLAAAEAGIEARRSAVPFLPEDVELAKAILKALRVINDKGEEECLERVFSLRCFGDSKFFEKNIRKKVIDIIRNSLLGKDYDSEAPTDDDLAQVGIVKAPEQVEFSGGIIGTLAGKQVDFSVFRHGIAISFPSVASLEITGFTAVRRIIFIENKANYVDYILKNKKEDELVIFHGGFYGPSRGLFFQKLYEAGRIAGVEFYHWSDIDWGGFKIFHRLKSRIIPELKPFLMDREALLSRKNYWTRFDQKYGAELERLLGLPDYAEFHDVIRTMLTETARLEQEAFLLSG